MKASVQVTILGQTFTLRSDANPEEMRRVVTFVNDALAEVAAGGKTVDSYNAAVLALLNVSQAFLQLEQRQLSEQQELNARLGSLLSKIEALSR